MITEAQLYSLLDSARDIEYLRERIERLRSSLESASPALGRIGSSSSAEPDKMAANIARLADMQDELAEKIYGRELLIMQLEGYVAKLPEPECTVIKLRYVIGLSWASVADKVALSVRHCTRLNRKFLRRMKRRP